MTRVVNVQSHGCLKPGYVGNNTVRDLIQCLEGENRLWTGFHVRYFKSWTSTTDGSERSFGDVVGLFPCLKHEGYLVLVLAFDRRTAMGPTCKYALQYIFLTPIMNEFENIAPRSLCGTLYQICCPRLMTSSALP